MDSIGEYSTIGVIKVKGDTRSLDYNAYDPLHNPRYIAVSISFSIVFSIRFSIINGHTRTLDCIVPLK